MSARLKSQKAKEIEKSSVRSAYRFDNRCDLQLVTEGCFPFPLLLFFHFANERVGGVKSEHK